MHTAPKLEIALARSGTFILNETITKHHIKTILIKSHVIRKDSLIFQGRSLPL
jgi:hypothetical protein